jgi:hypothetical protein
VNAVFWEPGRCPVNPTEEEIAEQKRRNGVSLKSTYMPEDEMLEIVEKFVGVGKTRQ